ncbi:hypothetical protein AN958_11480 [Leucoagaricus sp. SymC.cos]|nr:hypothetical protein AN958_11480 [Leucoagaricus sp. SymC.cos]
MNRLHHPSLVQQSSRMLLPLELVQAIDQTYFLHILAIYPEKVLPPGKSLISVVTQEKLGDKEQEEAEKNTTTAVIEQQVTKAMRTAFWDLTAERLSSSQPSEQNVQIKQLLHDLHEAISPLLPPEDPLLEALSLPPAPSSAPLYSFVVTLKEILTTLRQRCAPIRDGEIDRELHKLEDLPSNSTRMIQTLPDSQIREARSTGVLPIATLITRSLKAIATITDNMKSDLHDFFLGSMTEEQLRALVMREAKARERDIVVRLWSFHDQERQRRGEDIIREDWRFWCKQDSEADMSLEEDRWKSRLLKALMSRKPVSCILPAHIVHAQGVGPPPENGLPPQFFLSTTSLHHVQDYLQAMVIAAVLRSLTRLPPSNSLPTSVETSANNFMQRVWTLLEAELDAQSEHERSSDSPLSPLKLINLEDEVIRARQLLPETLGLSEEEKLRKAVRRALQPGDPVFSLLQKRLMEALLKGIVMGSSSRRGVGVPGHLRAGRSPSDRSAAGKQLRLMISDEELVSMREVTSPSIVGLIPSIKGFEDPVLSKAVEEAFSKLSKIVGWTESVWGDLV